IRHRKIRRQEARIGSRKSGPDPEEMSLGEAEFILPDGCEYQNEKRELEKRRHAARKWIYVVLLIELHLLRAQLRALVFLLKVLDQRLHPLHLARRGVLLAGKREEDQLDHNGQNDQREPVAVAAAAGQLHQIVDDLVFPIGPVSPIDSVRYNLILC